MVVTIWGRHHLPLEVTKSIVITVEGTKDWAIGVLAALYACIAVFALFEVVRVIVRAKSHGRPFFSIIMAYHPAFLLLVFVVAGMRAVLFTWDFRWPSWALLMFVYEYSFQFLEFWLFSLLVLFLAKVALVIHGQQRRLRHLYVAYATLLAVLFIAVLLLSILFTPAPPDYDNLPAVLASCSFGVLSIVLAISGYKTYIVLKKISLSEHKAKKVKVYANMILLYFSILCVRIGWDLSHALSCNVVQEMLFRWQTGTPWEVHRYNLFALGFYGLLEAFPLLSITLWLKMYLPETRRDDGHGAAPLLPSARALNTGDGTAYTAQGVYRSTSIGW